MTDIPASLADLDGDDPLPGEPKTELGYARRLIHVYGDRLRYVPAWRRWLVWDGRRWAHDATGQAQRWMKVIARRLTTDALAIEDEQNRKAAVSLARRGESSPRRRRGAHPGRHRAGHRGHPRRPRRRPVPAQLPQRHPGPADRRAAAHDPADLLTKMTGAAYRPGAAGAEFAKFLERVQPDAGDARLPRPAHRPRPGGPGRRRTSCRSSTATGANGKGTLHRRGARRARRLRRRRRPRAADRPRPSTRTRPAPPTCSACGWPSCTRPTRAAAWPRAPSSG